MSDPQGFVTKVSEKINQMDNLKNFSLAIGSSEPTEYLGSYLAACRSGMKLSVSPEIAEEFKGKIMVNLNNDLKKSEDRDKKIESFGNILFNADKR